ncbi:hypothetical protein BH23CHL8_BH23CHL8_29830 [soil metagenome]
MTTPSASSTITSRAHRPPPRIARSVFPRVGVATRIRAALSNISARGQLGPEAERSIGRKTGARV